MRTVAVGRLRGKDGGDVTHILQKVLRQTNPGVPQEAVLHNPCAMAISTRTQFQGVRQHMVQGIHFLCSTGNLDKHRQSHLETERQESQGSGGHTPSENTLAQKTFHLKPTLSPYPHTLTTAEQLFSLPLTTP